MSLYIDNCKVKLNVPFFIYFLLMFCLYTNTYVQLFAQFFIIIFVLLSLLKNPIFDTLTLKNLLFYLFWFGLFFLIIYLSQKWAYSVFNGSSTVNRLFRITVIGFMIFLYCNSFNRIYSVSLSFIYAFFVTGIIVVFSTILLGGSFGVESFGSIIGQHRNQIGAVSSVLVFLTFCYFKCYKFEIGKYLSLFFIALTFLTGSRSSILQLIIIFSILMLFGKKKNSIRLKHFFIFCLILIIGYLIIKNNSFLYENIYLRAYNGFMTLIGVSNEEKSALGRSLYKDIAFNMFRNRPLLGYGVDGFICFLRDLKYYKGYYLPAVYSHCNYAEIAADFGIVGLISWYIPILFIIFSAFKCRNNSFSSFVYFAVFLSMVLFDYSRIPWDTHLIMYLFFIFILLIRVNTLRRSDINV